MLPCEIMLRILEGVPSNTGHTSYVTGQVQFAPEEERYERSCHR